MIHEIAELVGIKNVLHFFFSFFILFIIVNASKTLWFLFIQIILHSCKHCKVNNTLFQKPQKKFFFVVDRQPRGRGVSGKGLSTKKERAFFVNVFLLNL